MSLGDWQRRLVFPRFAAPVDPLAGEGIEGLERLAIDVEQGQVEAFLIPGRGASDSSPAPVVIFAHGNAELIDYWTHSLSAYREMGITVIVPEYRGYGRSDGSPSQVAITEDFVRFYDLVNARSDIDAERIVFHGRSLGGGVVCALARHRRPAGLILQSTFRSVAVLARRYLAPRFLVLDPFDNEAALRELSGVPRLVIHGRRDTLIPPAHAEALARIEPGTELILYDAGHNDCPPDLTRYWVDLRRFLARQGICSQQESPGAEVVP